MSKFEVCWVKIFPDSQESLMDQSAYSTGHSAQRIMLVEDDPTTSLVMNRLLSRMGYEVRAADSFAGALQVMAETPADIVLCDIGLPDGSGYDLMTELRKRSTAVGIAMTGYDDQEDVERSVRAGFAYHLVKPIDFETLKTILSQVESS